MRKEGEGDKIKLLVPSNFTAAVAANIQSPVTHPTQLRFSPPSPKKTTEVATKQEAKPQEAADVTG